MSTAQGRVVRRPAPGGDPPRRLAPLPAEGDVLVRTLYSGISAGTELLAYRGEIDPDLALDETIGALGGTFRYPFRYGYSCVGVVEASRIRRGRGHAGVRLPPPPGPLRRRRRRRRRRSAPSMPAGRHAVPAGRDRAADHARRRPAARRARRGVRPRRGRAADGRPASARPVPGWWQPNRWPGDASAAARARGGGRGAGRGLGRPGRVEGPAAA